MVSLYKNSINLNQNETEELSDSHLRFKSGIQYQASNYYDLGLSPESIKGSLEIGSGTTTETQIKLAEENSFNSTLESNILSELNKPEPDLETIESLVGLKSTFTPSTVSVEKAAAAQTINENLSSDTVIQGVISEELDKAEGLIDVDTARVVQDSLTNQAILYDKLLEVQNKVSQTGLLSTIGDITETLIPGYNLWLESSGIEDLNTSFFLGKSREQQRDYLWSLTPEELKNKIKEVDEDLISRGLFGTNDINRLMYWMDMVGFSHNDSVGRTVFQFLDVAEIGVLPLGLASKSKGLSKMGRSMSTIRKSNLGREKASQETANTLTAIEQGAVDVESVEGLDAVLNSLPSFLDPTLDTTVSISESVAKNRERLREVIEDFNETVVTGRVRTVDEAAAVAEAKRDLENSIRLTRSSETSLGKELADINVIESTDIITDNLGIKQLEAIIGTGLDGQKGFVSEEAARVAAEGYGLKNYTLTDPIENGGIFIKYRKDIPEGGTNLSTGFKLGDTKTGVLASVVSRSSVLTDWMSRSISITSDARGALASYTNSLLKPYTKLSKDQVDILDPIIELGLKERKWYTYDELKSFGLEDNLINAYDSWRAADEINAYAKNVDTVQDLVNRKYSQIGFKIADESGELQEFSLAGKVEGTLPDTGAVEIFNTVTKGIIEPGDISKVQLQSLIDEGYNLIKFAKESTLGPYGSFEYILTKSFNSGVLNRIQIPVLPGGRVQYRGDHFIKAPRIKKLKNGNTVLKKPLTLWVTDDPKNGKLFVNGWNNVAKAIRSGSFDDAALTRIVQKELGKVSDIGDINEFRRIVETAKLDITTDLEIVKDGQGLSQYHKMRADRGVYGSKEALTPTDSHEDLLYLHSRGQRLHELPLKNVGTREAPLARPIETATRSMNQVIRLKALNPLIRKVSDNWMKSYKHLFKDDFVKGVSNRDFFEAAQEGFLRSDLGKDEQALAREALMIKKQMDRFLSTPTTEEKWLSRVAEEVSEKMGMKTSTKGYKLLTEGSPINFMRGVAFHTKLGLFSVHQLVVQTSASIIATAIHPVQGFKAFTQYTPLRLALINSKPSNLDYFSKMASHLSFGQITPDEFKRLYKDLKRSGKWHVQGETTYNADVREALHSSSLVNNTLRHGSFFFTEAERANAIVGYSISWLDWHKRNPGKLLSEAPIEEFEGVSRYADILVGNMRKSGDALIDGRGLLSVPLQFTSYQRRLVETMLPTKLGGTPFLSNKQKAQVALGQLAAWGTRGSLGGAAGVGLSQAINEFYTSTFGESPSKDVLNILERGLVDSAFSYLLDTDSGIGGISGARLYENLITDIMKGDVTPLEVLGGPSLSITSNITENLYKPIQALFLADVDTPDKISFALTGLSEVLKEDIASTSRGYKAWVAYKTGMVINKNYDVLAKDVSKLQAALIPLGVDPNMVGDTYTIEEVVRNWESSLDQTRKGLSKEFKRFLIRLNTDGEDVQSAQKDWRTAVTFYTMGLSDVEKRNVMQSVSRISTPERYSKGIKKFLNIYGFDNPISENLLENR